MKNTELITLPKTSLMKVAKKRAVRSIPTIQELDESDGVVDKLWDMYQKQLQRTHEMMLLCDSLQKENDELKRNQQLIALTKEEKPKEEKERKLEPIGYDKLKTLTRLLKRFFPGYMSRTAYANALVHMLYMLKQLKGEATPQQLFAAADLTDVSGFRYIGFLKKARMVSYSPTTKKGYYILTDVGKQFIDGKLETEDDFCKACGIDAIFMLNLQ